MRILCCFGDRGLRTEQVRTEIFCWSTVCGPCEGEAAAGRKSGTVEPTNILDNFVVKDNSEGSLARQMIDQSIASRANIPAFGG